MLHGRFTLHRDVARERADLDLLGLDHPLVQDAIKRWQAASPDGIGVSVAGRDLTGVLTWWLVEARGHSGAHRSYVVPLGVGEDGRRQPRLERLGFEVFARTGSVEVASNVSARGALLTESIEPMLQRELEHREIVRAGGTYAAKLVGWVELG